MRSRLLSTSVREDVERAVKVFINQQQPFLSERTADSPRAAGDAIQTLLASNLAGIVGEEFCINYTSGFARRAMADMAFDDTAGCHYVVDVKTHRLGTAFNMPNLTSVERLARFYAHDDNYYVVLSVSYEVTGISVTATEVRFVPIEFLDWSCLTIGALGWGQIQIANANRIVLNAAASRRDWMLELCRRLLDFYPRELAKIQGRIEYFRGVEDVWRQRPS